MYNKPHDKISLEIW